MKKLLSYYLNKGVIKMIDYIIYIILFIIAYAGGIK